MQEMFYKDLEEIKKSQLIMNNTITQMKSTLEGTNNGITEEEERIRVEEDRMMEIKQSGKKKKDLKEMRTISETTGTMLNSPAF